MDRTQDEITKQFLESMKVANEEFARNNRVRLEANPKLLVGSRDPRLRFEGLHSTATGPSHERLPLALKTEGFLSHSRMTWEDHWAHAPAWECNREAVEKALAHLPASERCQVLFDLIPHTIRIVTVVWHDGKVLMRLREPGTEKKPASTIGFPQSTLLGYDRSLEEAAEKIAKSAFSPFIKPDWDVALATSWSVIYPERPEVLLVRHAEFKGDPAVFFGSWAEEQYYPWVWVDAEDVAEAAEGDATHLVQAVRVADEWYRSLGRDLETAIDILESCEKCGSTLKSGSYKVPLKSSLTVTDALTLDEASREVAGSVTVAS